MSKLHDSCKRASSQYCHTASTLLYHQVTLMYERHISCVKSGLCTLGMSINALTALTTFSNGLSNVTVTFSFQIIVTCSKDRWTNVIVNVPIKINTTVPGSGNLSNTYTLDFMQLTSDMNFWGVEEITFYYHVV